MLPLTAYFYLVQINKSKITCNRVVLHSNKRLWSSVVPQHTILVSIFNFKGTFMSSKLTLPEYTYYYGFTKEQIIALADLPYKQALLSKIDSAKSLLSRLLDKPFMEQDTTRSNDVLKAIKFNESLIDELRI